MIGPAEPGDAPAVHALVQDAYGHYVARIGKPPAVMRDDYARRITAEQVWVIKDEGAMLGLVVLEDHPDFLLLDNVAVSPRAQGHGLGRRLIAFAEDEARRRGYDELRLYTHVLMVENIVIYQHLGFAEMYRVREQGFDRVYMAKTLE